MNKVWGVSSDGERYALAFDCPGCQRTHIVDITTKHRPSAWSWNGSMDKPTFAPSLLVTWQATSNGEPTKRELTCHSFIRDGFIEFLNDCTHPLAGKTVELPEVAEAKEWT